MMASTVYKREISANLFATDKCSHMPQAVPAATVYVPGRSATYENQASMKPMKTAHLAEINFTMDVYSLECREVYKNTTLVFSVAFRRSWYKT